MNPGWNEDSGTWIILTKGINTRAQYWALNSVMDSGPQFNTVAPQYRKALDVIILDRWAKKVIDEPHGAVWRAIPITPLDSDELGELKSVDPSVHRGKPSDQFKWSHRKAFPQLYIRGHRNHPDNPDKLLRLNVCPLQRGKVITASMRSWLMGSGMINELISMINMDEPTFSDKLRMWTLQQGFDSLEAESMDHIRKAQGVLKAVGMRRPDEGPVT